MSGAWVVLVPALGILLVAALVVVVWGCHGEPKHEHDWIYVGNGGAGWHLIRCSTCQATEIEP